MARGLPPAGGAVKNQGCGFLCAWPFARCRRGLAEFLMQPGAPRKQRRCRLPAAPYTTAYTAFGVKCLVAPEVPNNAGSLAPITGQRAGGLSAFGGRAGYFF